uniref:Prune exopolyphosphatase n=1 Tax=Myripristis murdjan TaxID=586833 RepID=A0A667YX60_9TELE
NICLAAGLSAGRLLTRLFSPQNGSHGNLLFHVVLGDESCDLDSVVSSLAMAYFLSQISPGNSVVVPVLNVPRSEFQLRADCRFLLTEVGVAMETLVFRDEVDLGRLHGNRRLALTLVDHNVLSSTDSGLQGAVVEVIDHHQLETNASSSCSVAVETVASCATMVTERILSRAPQILDRQLALLLYGAVVLGGAPLCRGGGADGQVVELLEAQFPELPARGALQGALHRARTDLTGQSLLGNVVVLCLCPQSFLRRSRLQQELCQLCAARRLAALVAMTISFNNQSHEPVRQLAVYSSSSAHRQQISHALWSSQSPALCLSPVSCPYKDILAYQQGNSLASRRKLLPVLRRFLSGWERAQVHCGAEEEELEQLDMMISDSLRSAGGAVPPTPTNSLVDGCPLDAGFNQEALLEKFSRMGGATEEQGGGGL